MKFLDIVKKKTFTQNGEEKTKWLKPAGTLKINDNGKMFIEMNDGVEYFVFEQKDRNEVPAVGNVAENVINVDETTDLPF